MKDLTSRIIEYEDGGMDQDEVIALFQDLVDTGMAWQLQGSYGRMAKALIDAGLVKVKKVSSTDWSNLRPDGTRYRKGE